MAERLKFAPSILARLGEELVPHPDQGILELAKNAYDADARWCRVTLNDVTRWGGTVAVTDDGDGMTLQQIREGWLILGRSEKDPSRRTRLGRLPVGQKGLGRLAALRLGRRVVLATRPVSEPGVEYWMEIDWERFDKADAVEDVALIIHHRLTSKPSGTSITISHLSTALGRMDTKRLARSLILLADPFESTRGFRAELITDDFRDLENLVRSGYFAEAHYRLSATLDSDGSATAEVTDHQGNLKWKAGHNDLRESGPYRAPPATLELWEFRLTGESFSHSKATLGEVKNWLREVGGVHFYYRGLRVRPYGDRGHDWLEMNLRRVRSPEQRPSTNNSIGLVIVDDDPDNLLGEKTDRSGFIENRAFSEIRDFAGDALDWMAHRRVGERDRKRRKQRHTGQERVAGARKDMEKAVAQIPEDQRKDVQAAMQQLEKARENERESILSDLQLYRTLSTVGTTASVFAHEAAGPLNRIERLANTIEHRCRNTLAADYQPTIGGPVRLLHRAARALRSFVRLPLTLLQREKRRIRTINLHQAIDEVLELFDPFLADSDVTVKTEYVDASFRVQGRTASLEAILANLITNSISAFQRSDTLESREILIRTVQSGDRMLLSVRDNGPGIRGIARNDIWNPGQTTTPGGTGIGLTIVRDEAADIGGRAYLAPDTEEGGAEFIVELPLLGLN